MKTKLFFLIFLGIFSVKAQTTHNLDWEREMGSNVDLTIEVGDTIIWTWIDNNHTVENDPAGSSVEVFNSGFLGPAGSTFSHTFTVVGSNDYYCGVHGAESMSGTITVQDVLGIEEAELDSFNLVFNSIEKLVTVILPQNLSDGFISMYDITGKRAFSIMVKNQNFIELNVSSLKNGIYIISIESNSIKQSKQFLKY